MVLSVEVPRLIDESRFVTNFVENPTIDKASSRVSSSGEVENLMGPQSCSSSRAEPILSAQK